MRYFISLLIFFFMSMLGQRCQAYCPHHVYFGPECFTLSLDSNFQSAHVEGSKFFIGARLCYEYLRRQAIYFGVEVAAAGASSGFHETLDNIPLPKNTEATGFGHIEFRGGYSFCVTEGLFSPYICLGGYSFGTGLDQHSFDDGISYLGGGIKYKYAYSPCFHYGINLKLFRGIYREEELRFFERKEAGNDTSWGAEVSLPLVWGLSRRWDIQLEPFFTKLMFSQRANIFGARLLFGTAF